MAGTSGALLHQRRCPLPAVAHHLRRPTQCSLQVVKAASDSTDASQSYAPPPNLAGRWLKDLKRSDSMDAACRLVGMSGPLLQAVRLIRGMEISLEGGNFEMAVFGVIPWFKIREVYPLDGRVSENGRRDLRFGVSRGSVLSLANGEVQLSLAWEEPVAGTGVDVFRLLNDNEMQVTSSVTVGDTTEVYRSVHYRSKP